MDVDQLLAPETVVKTDFLLDGYNRFDSSIEASYCSGTSSHQIALDMMYRVFGTGFLALLETLLTNPDAHAIMMLFLKDLNPNNQSYMQLVKSTRKAEMYPDVETEAERVKEMPTCKFATPATWAAAIARESVPHVLTPFNCAVSDAAPAFMSSDECKLVFAPDIYTLPDYEYSLHGLKPQRMLGVDFQKSVMAYFNLSMGSVGAKSRTATVDKGNVRMSLETYRVVVDNVSKIVPKDVAFTNFNAIRALAESLAKPFGPTGNRNAVSAFKPIKFDDDKYEKAYSRLPTVNAVPQLYLANRKVLNFELDPHIPATTQFSVSDLQEFRNLRKIGDLGDCGKEPFDIFTMKFNVSPIKKFLDPMLEALPFATEYIAFGHSEANNWETFLKSWNAHIYTGDFTKFAGNQEKVDFRPPALLPYVDCPNIPNAVDVRNEEWGIEDKWRKQVLIRFNEGGDSYAEFLANSYEPRAKYVTVPEDDGRLLGQMAEWEDAVKLAVNPRLDAVADERDKLAKLNGSFPIIVSDIHLAKEQYFAANVKMEDKVNVYWKWLENMSKTHIVIFKWVSNRPNSLATRGSTFDWETLMLAHFEGKYFSYHNQSRLHNGEVIFTVFPDVIGKYLHLETVTLMTMRQVSRKVSVRMMWGNSVRTLLLTHGITQTSYGSGYGLFALRYLNPTVKKYWSHTNVSSLQEAHISPADEEKQRQKIKENKMKAQQVLEGKVEVLQQKGSSVPKDAKKREAGINNTAANTQNTARRVGKRHI